LRISRRQFLSWGLAAGAAAAVQGSSWAYFGHVMRTSDRRDTPVPTVCRACPAACGIVGYVRKDKELVAIMGNPEHPVSRGKLCALALAAINLHYHPERLLRPQRIDRAKAEMTPAVVEAGRTIARLVADGARVVVDTWDETPALGAFAGAKGQVISREALAGYNRARVMEAVWGVEVRPDFDRADLLLVFGANPFEGGPRFIHDARRMVEARVERGMRMIVFDPRLSNTGGRADLWAPLRPGTDRVAALAILRYAMERANLDEMMMFGQAMLPLAELTKVVDPFDMATAARLCGLPAKTLTEAAAMYVAATRPATMAGGGVFEQVEADDAYRAIALLDTLGGIRPVAVMPRPWRAPSTMMMAPDEAENFYAGLERGSAAKVVLITHRANPVYERGPALERALRAGAVAYHLSISPFPNETTALAHLTLPEALPIESSGRAWLSSYVPTPTFAEQKPVVAPPPDVWTADEIFRALASSLNAAAPANEDYDLEQVRQWTGAQNFTAIGQGIFAGDSVFTREPMYQAPLADLAKLARLPDVDSDENSFRLVLHGSSVTSSDSARGKWLAEINHAGALFLHPDDARRLRVREGDKVRVRGQAVGGVEFAREVAVFVSDGVRPGCAALVEEQGHNAEGKLAAAKRFHSDLDPDTELLWWEVEGNGANLSPLVSRVVNSSRKLTASPPPKVQVEEA